MANAKHLHGEFGLLPTHKHFILAYETALRDECGYKGYHPVRCYPTPDPWPSFAGVSLPAY